MKFVKPTSRITRKEAEEAPDTYTDSDRQGNAVYTSKSGLTEKSTHASNEILAEDYDGVVIPGGFSPEFMRRTKATVDFVRDWIIYFIF